MNPKSTVNHRANVKIILELAGMELEAQEELDICHEITEQREKNERAYGQSYTLVENAPKLLFVCKQIAKVLSGNRTQKFRKEFGALRRIIQKCERSET